MTTTESLGGSAAAWLVVLRRYLPFVVLANLAWEALHLPLYSIWDEGSPHELAFAVVHCTGGDALIATAALVLALLLVGSGWPSDRAAYRRVAALTLAIGIGYALFSEWLNIVVRKAWAYSDLMPVVPGIDAGLSPILQWIVIPLAGFGWARRGLVQLVSKT